MRMNHPRVALAAATVVVILSAGSAEAQSLGQSLFSKLLGTSDDQPAINYSERAPLVLPPKRELAPPADATALQQDPSWPKDADAEKRRKKASEDSRGPASSNTELATREEMEAGTLRGPSQDTRSSFQAEQEYKRMSNPVNPKALARSGTFGTPAEPFVAGVEPTRRSLIDPPKGYRAPLATAPLAGNEPLPSEVAAEENKPWYQKVWKFGGGND